MEKLDTLAFIKKNGFIWGPEPEIYGGVAGFYSYGPLGKLLKDNVEQEIRKIFRQNGFWEIEYPIITPKKVWHASGHLMHFVDPVIKCKKCLASFRVDSLIKELYNTEADSWTRKRMQDYLNKKKARCPNCKGEFINKIEDYNLMMKTTIEQDKVAFNRPETATSTYLSFKNYYEFFRKKLPMQVFQIGKVFRNEISPRQNVIRGREFTQAEAQLFVKESEKNNWPKYNEIKSLKLPFWSAELQHTKRTWAYRTVEGAMRKKWIKSKSYAWCLALTFQFLRDIGIPKDRIRLRQHTKDEMAHYAADAWDFEVNLNTFGWTELVGVHDRQNYDLKQHSKYSNEKLRVDGEYPHILEIAFGSDRPTFTLLDLFLTRDKVNGDNRVVLKLPPHMAPVKVAIFPLMNRDGIPEVAEKIFDDLKEEFVCVYDSRGSIGKRYRRQDERGCPLTITCDYDSLKDQDVTLRERDSMKQIRVPIENLLDKIQRILSGEIRFEDAGKLVK